jgi:large subunit ribosomal protein L10
MPSLLNQLIHRETKKAFEDNSSVVFVNYNTFTQDDSVAFRAKATEVGASARVIKNSVAAIALKDLGVEGADALLAGPVLAVMGEDPVSVSKVAADFARKKKKGEVLGGVVDLKLVGADEVNALSKLPSKEALVGMFVNVVASPLRGLVTVLNGNIRGLAQVMNAIKEKKEQEAA